MRDQYQDYQPPFNARRLIRRLLTTVPPNYLDGLSHVVMTNNPELILRRAVISRPRHRPHDRKDAALGLYRWSPGSLPYIEIRVDEICMRLKTLGPQAWVRREVAFSSVLFHEVGHHLHNWHQLIPPNLTASEDIADEYSRRLMTNALRLRYWYVSPLPILAIELYRSLRKRNWIQRDEWLQNFD